MVKLCFMFIFGWMTSSILVGHPTNCNNYCEFWCVLVGTPCTVKNGKKKLGHPCSIGYVCFILGHPVGLGLLGLCWDTL